MLSLFRQKIEKDPPEKDKHVFYLINSVTDPKTQSFRSISQIHQNVLDNLHETKQFLLLQDEAGNLDPVLFKAYMDELKTYGPPSPIQVKTEPVSMSSSPLQILWADFSLEQKKHSFFLAFQDPGKKNLVQMELVPSNEVLHLNDYEIPNLETTFYNIYTRMNVSGRSGSEAIHGKAWMDHQWGDFDNWFFSKSDKRRYLGWNWIGVNFDDGSDLVITTHLDMEKNEVLDRGALYMQPRSAPQVLGRLSMEPTAYWESPQTHAVYPIEWKVSIPELDIHFAFTPLHKEQEIPFFGFIRAVWEGAGEIKGRKKNKPVSGLARLELHGYAYLFNFKDYLQTFSRKVDETIESFFPKKLDKQKTTRFTGKAKWSSDPEALTSVLSKPVWDLISRKGRRWRPLFGLLALESLGVNPEPYKELICSTMELNHTGALIIDDIEDQSLIRRGDECIHLKYGEDIAINAGCTLYFLPYLLVKENPFLNESQKRQLYEIMNQIMIKAHFGQAMDIYWSHNLTAENYRLWTQDSLESKILQMYAHKTGAAVEGGSEAACVISEASEEVLRTYRAMAIAFGTAFQIIDDVHNFSSSSDWTKQTAEDISSGKLTYVIHKAIQNSDKKDGDALLSILCSKEMRHDPGKLETAVHIIKESGVLASCKKQASDMIEKEWKNFSKIIPMTEAKIQIKLMITGLLNFNYET